MNVFEFVIAIVFIAMIGKVLQARFQAHAPGERTGSDPAIARAQEEVRALKERIQVLERVITDNHGSHDLDREIERLRDR